MAGLLLPVVSLREVWGVKCSGYHALGGAFQRHPSSHPQAGGPRFRLGGAPAEGADILLCRLRSPGCSCQSNAVNPGASNARPMGQRQPPEAISLAPLLIGLSELDLWALPALTLRTSFAHFLFCRLQPMSFYRSTKGPENSTVCSMMSLPAADVTPGPQQGP